MKSVRLSFIGLCTFCMIYFSGVTLSVLAQDSDQEIPVSEDQYLINRLSILEESIAAVQNQLGASAPSVSFEEMQSLRDSLANYAVVGAATKMDVAGSLIIILATILAVITLIIGASTFAVRQWVKESVLKQTEALIAESVDTTSQLALAEMHSQLSFSFYESYGLEFDKWKVEQFAGEPKRLEILVEFSSFAAHLAKRGLKQLENDRFRTKLASRPQWPRERAKLQNHLLYNETAELICRRAQGSIFSEAKRFELIRLAEECLKTATSEALAYDIWFEIHDSAALALIQLGTPSDAARGKNLVKDVCAGKKPSAKHTDVPSARVDTFRAEYAIS